MAQFLNTNILRLGNAPRKFFEEKKNKVKIYTKKFDASAFKARFITFK